MSRNTTPAALELLPLDCFQPAFSRTALLGAVMGGALGLTPLAHAQSQDNVPTMAPVTVTGQQESQSSYQAPAQLESPKFTAPLLDTPKTVTIVPEAVIRDRGATSLQDVLRTTPGITLGSGEGGTPTGDRPFVRGYEASTDIFVDGVRDYARGSHETFNLESVQVTKGPSSAYTGRGGTGGSINLQTKKPQDKRFFDVSAGFGNASQYRVAADLNLPFNDLVAARLNVMKMGGDVPGRGGVSVDRLGVAPSITIGMNRPTRLTLSYSYLANDDMPDLGVPFSNAANPARTTPPNVNRNNFYGRLNADFRENTQKHATIQFEHDFSSTLKLRNTLRHSDALNHYLMTRPTFDNCTAGAGAPCADEGPAAQFRRDDRMRWRQVTALLNQTDLYGSFHTGPFKHNFSAGIEFARERVYSKTMANGPGRSHDSLWNPNPHDQYNFNIRYGDRTSDGQIKSSSLYFFDTMEINPQFSVNAGVRRDSFDVSNNTLRRKDSFWNYQLGVVYKPAENGSVYFSLGTSSNPVGENLGQNGGADGPSGAAQIRDLAPERSRSWELGTKWDVLDQRLSLTAALFETRKNNARSTDPVTGDVSLSGKNRVRGLELSASGNITPKWGIWAGYTYLDPQIITYRSGRNVFDGKQMKFIAKQSATLWTTYKVLPNLTLGGGMTYTGMRYADDANTLKLPSWVRWDAMASYEVNRQLSIRFNVNNIANKPLFDASHVGVFANIAPGRSYMLTANYRFD